MYSWRISYNFLDLCFVYFKAQLKLKRRYFFLVHLFAREKLLMKKMEIEETKTTQYSTFKTDILKVGLVFSISNFFIYKCSLVNKWMSFSCSNSALVTDTALKTSQPSNSTFQSLSSKKVQLKALTLSKLGQLPLKIFLCMS